MVQYNIHSLKAQRRTNFPPVRKDRLEKPVGGCADYSEMIKLPLLLIPIIGLALSSCVQRPATDRPGPWDEPWPEEKGPMVTEPSTPTDKDPSSPKTYVDQPIPTTTSPAVLALMRDAQSQSRQGNLDAAVTTIERAVRIQPRNAELWHRLALLRLQQERPRLAEDLAKKSNTLAGANYNLRRKNWSLIAVARRRLGDMDGAYEAEEKAAQY